MKILLAIEGSDCSRAAVEEVIRRPWPSGSELRILSVAHPMPFIPDPTMMGAAAYQESLEKECHRATEVVQMAAKRFATDAPGLSISTQVLDGSPKKIILQEAEGWDTDLLVLGSHGHGPVHRFLLGSVAQAVALHAHCSVEIVRCRHLVNSS